jgi:hypothetical protein
MGVPRDSLEKPKPILKDSLKSNSLQLANQQKMEELAAPADTAILLMKADSTFNKLPAPKKQ